jgi:hypothetical protein
VVVAITYGGTETHIRRYSTDDPATAIRLFTLDWIEGRVQWHYFEFFGPGCTVDNPAFTPEFLREHCLDEQRYREPTIIEGVHVWDWYCCTGIHGSDEHLVTGYFVPPSSVVPYATKET